MTETKIEKPAAEKKPAAKAKKPASNNAEVMQKHTQMIQFVQNMLGNIETEVKRMNLVLQQLSKFNPEDSESFMNIEK